MVSQVSLNHSHVEECWMDPEDISEPPPLVSPLVSPLVVAGIVIGLVLFLSCVTIIIGSLRKDSRLRTPHLRTGYGPDGFSYGGSLGELGSACLEDFPPGLDFHSYTETLSQAQHGFQDSPPGYDECIGPGAPQLFIPAEDPPPYSLLDPFLRGAGQEEEPAYITPYPYSRESAASWLSPDQRPIGLQDPQQLPIASISLPQEAAPAYDSLVTELPLMPCDLYKHQSGGAGAQHHRGGADRVV